jgi:hypothetical protein
MASPWIAVILPQDEFAHIPRKSYRIKTGVAGTPVLVESGLGVE